MKRRRSRRRRRQIVPLKIALRDFERELIRQAIEEMGSIAAGARALKVAPTTLKYKCKKYRISSPWRYGQAPR